VAWDESVAEFKVRLGRVVGVSPCRQILLCGTCELESHCPLERYASEAPLALTLLVRQSPSEEVVTNTRKLVTALRVGMAPRPCQMKTLVRCRPASHQFYRSQTSRPSSTKPVTEHTPQLCIHAQARKLVPGRTPAARKLRELRRKALAWRMPPKPACRPPSPWGWRAPRYYAQEDCHEQTSWAGLEADVERTVRHGEVDLEGFQVLKKALRAGCGELALLCLRHGADPTAVSLREAVVYFRGRDKPRSSDPLMPSPDILFRNPAEGFTLVRAICDLWQRRAAISKPPVDGLSAARFSLARATTKLALLRSVGGDRITKQEVVHAAGMPHTELDAYGDSLWAGWPMTFLTFSEPRLGTCRRLDPDFMRVRACLVASSICQPRPEPARARAVWYEWMDEPWLEEAETDLESLNKEYDLRKCCNQKWRDSWVTRRRVRRVPWATGNGTAASRSSRLARRLPKSASHIWATGRRRRKNQPLDWDVESVDPMGEYYMPSPMSDVEEAGGTLPAAPSARLFGMWTLNLKQHSQLP